MKDKIINQKDLIPTIAADLYVLSRLLGQTNFKNTSYLIKYAYETFLEEFEKFTTN